MSNVANKYKVGVFVVFSIVLLVAAFITLGALSFMAPKEHIMTVVKGSVQGLEVGAKVKYKGVTVGKVTRIQVSPVDDNIWIFMVFSFTKEKYEEANMTYEQWRDKFFKELPANIKRGMRCQLRYEGITGNLYQEVSFFDPKQYPIDESIQHPEDIYYIPSVEPILMDNILTRVESSLRQIAQVDFVKISKQMEQLLHTGNELLDSKDIKQMMLQMRETSSNLQEISKVLKGTLTQERVDTVIKDFDQIVAELKKTMTTVDKFVTTADGELQKAKLAQTTADARKMMNTSTKAMQDLPAIRDDLRNTLADIQKAVDAARQLLEYLEKHPDALIRGKAGKPVVKP